MKSGNHGVKVMNGFVWRLADKVPRVQLGLTNVKLTVFPNKKTANNIEDGENYSLPWKIVLNQIIGNHGD